MAATKICIKCGVNPVAKNKAKYCSVVCQRAASVGTTPWHRKEINCEYCSKLFLPKTRTNTFCSKDCFNQLLQSKHIPKEVCCKECGTSFKTVYGDTRTLFCSKPCRSSYKSRNSCHSRRARLKGVISEPISSTKVFTRDNWTCKLCGIKTPKSLKGKNEPAAPTLDHIIPLSKGGPHTYENLQCACRQCNSLKQNKFIGQLPILLYNQVA